MSGVGESIAGASPGRTVTLAPHYAPQESVSPASLADSIRVAGGVLLPTITKGVILRRRAVMAIAERLDFDRGAVRCMERMSDRYRPGPLPLGIPGRSVALILDPADVHRVLEQTPEPFSAATPEKRGALAHFEPKNVLLSEGKDRAERRRFNEEVLDTAQPPHRLAPRFLQVVDSEAGRLMKASLERGELRWDEFTRSWFRIVRRVIFGDAARDDEHVSRTMASLRSAANWGFLRPRNTELLGKLLKQIQGWIERAVPGSLAEIMANIHPTRTAAPEHQVPQWLFAFDAAGMSAFRALALLCVNPEFARRVRGEIPVVHGTRPESAQCSRTAVLESLRLWPTTPLILRQTHEPTRWQNGVLPPETAIVLFVPFFHRNRDLPYADRFSPELWMDSGVRSQWPLIPFSEGPATCPGEPLVLLLTTAMIASILDRAGVRLKRPHALSPGSPLPGTLNHFALRFELRPRA